MDIFASRSLGLGLFEHFMVIMRDMRPHTLNHSLAIISLVMAAGGNFLPLNQVTKSSIVSLWYYAV